MNTITDDSAFNFVCPHCSQSLEATGEMIGNNLECPSCGKGFVVPTPAIQSTPQSVPLPDAVQLPLSSPPPLPKYNESAAKPIEPNSNKSNSQIIWDLVGWVIGILMVIFALSLIGTSKLSSILFIGGAFLMLPPVRRIFHRITKKKIPAFARVVAILAIFLLSIFLVGQASIRDFNKHRLELAAKKEKQAQEKEKQAQEKVRAAKEAEEFKKILIEEFRKNRETILSSIQTAFADQEIIEALSTSEKYLPADDKELNELHAQILAEREKIKAESKALADEITRRGNALRKRNKEIETQFSAWDGSHNKLERYIKEHLNDPSSYDHVKTTWIDKGDHIIVTTTFRGKNAFNATVVNTWVAKVSLAGDLLEVRRQ